MMDKHIYALYLNPHSFVDLITNSSTELFIVDNTQMNEITKELFDIICKGIDESFNESSCCKLNDNEYYSKYLILPENVDRDKVYLVELDNGDKITEGILKKYFTLIEYRYDEY